MGKKAIGLRFFPFRHFLLCPFPMIQETPKGFAEFSPNPLLTSIYVFPGGRQRVSQRSLRTVRKAQGWTQYRKKKA
jgi:hypothetical protein